MTEQNLKTGSRTFRNSTGTPTVLQCAAAQSASTLSTPPQNGVLFENPERDKWFTTKEAAEYLRVSPKRLLNLSSNGKVRFYKLGRSNRYRENDLKKLLLANPKGVLYGN